MVVLNGGYFDLVIRSNETRDDDATAAKPGAAGSASSGVVSRRFVWSGERYASLHDAQHVTPQ
jgi:hypothetical protein